MAKKKVMPSHNYHDHYGHDIQSDMERHMYSAAGRRHPLDDLNNGSIKPKDMPYPEAAKLDSKMAYHRAGLGPHSGADNDVESLMYAQQIGVCSKRKKK